MNTLLPTPHELIRYDMVLGHLAVTRRGRRQAKLDLVSSRVFLWQMSRKAHRKGLYALEAGLLDARLIAKEWYYQGIYISHVSWAVKDCYNNDPAIWEMAKAGVGRRTLWPDEQVIAFHFDPILSFSDSVAIERCWIENLGRGYGRVAYGRMTAAALISAALDALIPGRGPSIDWTRMKLRHSGLTCSTMLATALEAGGRILWPATAAFGAFPPTNISPVMACLGNGLRRVE